MIETDRAAEREGQRGQLASQRPWKRIKEHEVNLTVKFS